MNGFAVINKPSGMSSSDIVIKCRNALSKAINSKIKCGHMGTLDPMASGILIVAFGNTTRLFDYLLEKEKTYIATFVFGEERDTLDATGTVTGQAELPNYQRILDILPSFVGIVDQIPPKYSAVNINGRRAYDLARKGAEFEIRSKKVNIKAIEICDKILDGEKCKEIKLRIVCGGGTYIRSICRDLAYKANTLGHMSALVRTECGGFGMESSIGLQEFVASPVDHIIDTEKLLSKVMSFLEITDTEYRKIRNGQTVKKDIKDGYYGAKSNGKLCFIVKAEDNTVKSVCYLEDTNE